MTTNPTDALLATLSPLCYTRDLATLEAMLEAATDRLARHHIVNAIHHVRRANHRALLPAVGPDAPSLDL